MQQNTTQFNAFSLSPLWHSFKYICSHLSKILILSQSDPVQGGDCSKAGGSQAANNEKFLEQQMFEQKWMESTW